MECLPLSKNVFHSAKQFSNARFAPSLDNLFSLMDESMPVKYRGNFVLPPLDPSAKKTLLCHAHHKQITLTLANKTFVQDGVLFCFSEVRVIS
jgi:hypothetical protein